MFENETLSAIGVGMEFKSIKIMRFRGAESDVEYYSNLWKMFSIMDDTFVKGNRLSRFKIQKGGKEVPESKFNALFEKFGEKFDLSVGGTICTVRTKPLDFVELYFVPPNPTSSWSNTDNKYWLNQIATPINVLLRNGVIHAASFPDYFVGNKMWLYVLIKFCSEGSTCKNESGNSELSEVIDRAISQHCEIVKVRRNFFYKFLFKKECARVMNK